MLIKTKDITEEVDSLLRLKNPTKYIKVVSLNQLIPDMEEEYIRNIESEEYFDNLLPWVKLLLHRAKLLKMVDEVIGAYIKKKNLEDKYATMTNAERAMLTVDAFLASSSEELTFSGLDLSSLTGALKGLLTDYYKEGMVSAESLAYIFDQILACKVRSNAEKTYMDSIIKCGRRNPLNQPRCNLKEANLIVREITKYSLSIVSEKNFWKRVKVELRKSIKLSESRLARKKEWETLEWKGKLKKNPHGDTCCVKVMAADKTQMDCYFYEDKDNLIVSFPKKPQWRLYKLITSKLHFDEKNNTFLSGMDIEEFGRFIPSCDVSQGIHKV